MSFRFAPDRKAEIESYLAPLDAGRSGRLIEAIELQIGNSIRSARDGDFDAPEKLKRLSEDEQALEVFSRCFFGSRPDRANAFSQRLRKLVELDVLELLLEPSFQRPDNAAQLHVLQQSLLDRRLGHNVRELWQLMSQYKAVLCEQSTRRDREHPSLSAMAECGCRVYRLAHGRCPTPRKRKTDAGPDGPFDRFMMAIMDPVAAELRKSSGISYNWPTLMKYAARAQKRQLSAPPQGN
jgi:hypothetical protein